MQSKPNANEFARTKLPWIVAGVFLLIYLATLNHWVSVRSMPVIAKVTGWDASLPISMPLFHAVTFPFRLLPGGIQPIALNAFAAVCAALTIWLLVRSVALLPHDRTDEQRIRQRHSDGLLSTPYAWAPAVLAAGVLGLELTFWEHATAATNESLDLLIFAYLVRCALEFRFSKNETWLSKLAFVYGLGITNSWALIGFFPFFLGALIWMRGKSFFNWPFILRMTALGLAGMLLYLLLPLMWVAKGEGQATFWEVLRTTLVQQKMMIFNTQPLRARALILSLTSIIPIIIMGIRFPAGFGDISSAGANITNMMFRSIHILFAGACIFIAFDQQVSPRKLGLGLPFLSFYYLGALAAGYYIGYLMLVFTDPPRKHWRPTSPISKLINPVIQAAAWAAVALVPVALMIKNFKPTLNQNGDLLKDYAESVASQLPQKPAILLSEDAFQLALIDAWFSRAGTNPHILVNWRMLPYPAYHRELVKRYGDRWPGGGAREELRVQIDTLAIVSAFNALAVTNHIYYLHHSFGPLFEIFYPEYKGPVVELKRYATNIIYPPRLTKEQIQANEQYWKDAEGLIRRAEALTPMKLPDGVYVANQFSRALNARAVNLQRAGDFSNAVPVFDFAANLNTNNLPAILNLEYNQYLLTGKKRERTEQRLAEDFFGQYRSWDAIVAENGPFDVPEYLYAGGHGFRQAGYFRQAADQFARAAEIDPGKPQPKLALAAALIAAKWLDPAIAVINQARAHTNLNRGQQLDLISMEAAVYFGRNETNKAESTLLAALEKYPNDAAFYDSLGEMYRASLQWEKALALFDRRVERSPTNVILRLAKAEMALNAGKTNVAHTELQAIEKIDPLNVDAALFRVFLTIQEKDFKKGLEMVENVLLQRENHSQALTYKGILHMELKEDEKAIEAFNNAIKADRDNIPAIRNRAIVNLRAGHLDEAQSDYETLLSSLPKSHVIFYGLAEVAYQKKNRADALKNYELYLQYAPKDGVTPEVLEERKKVEARVQELKGAK